MSNISILNRFPNCFYDPAYGYIQIFIGFAHKHKFIIDFLLECGNSFYDSAVFKQSALIIAIEYNSLKIVKYIVNNGGTVNLYDRFGKTPLMIAIGQRIINFPIVEFLVDSGAIIDPPFPKPLELEFSCTTPQSNISSSHRYCTLTPLMIAVIHDQVDLLHYLIAKGADFTFIYSYTNYSDYDVKSKSALELAFMYSSVKCTKALLEYYLHFFKDNDSINKERDKRAIDILSIYFRTCSFDYNPEIRNLVSKILKDKLPSDYTQLVKDSEKARNELQEYRNSINTSIWSFKRQTS